MQKKYAIGIDYGTESGRVVLVDISNGNEVATHVTVYRAGVIDQKLPNSDQPLPHDYALQDPSDYLTVLMESIPEVMKQSGISPEAVIGIGLDFTACTLLPVDEALTPLCLQNKWKDHPHAWAKLWKHHAAQEEANQINQLAIERGENWLPRYGGRVSSEWTLPKVWEILKESPELFDETHRFMEAADWVVAKLTGSFFRNSCGAGYKGLWHKKEGYVTKDFLKTLDPRLEDLYETKLSGEILPVGTKAGELTPEMAEQIGLKPGTSVAIGMIDAHASMLGVGVASPGKMVLVMGTSTCHMLLSDKEIHVEGISGVVEDGIIPGFYAYEAGQAAVGDIFAWFVNHNVPSYVFKAAEKEGMSVHTWLEERASLLLPGESGLLALDWHNGNRTPLVDAELSGLMLGQTIQTKPEEMYRALIEATAFGTRLIMDAFRDQGTEINELYATGGIPHRNRLLMQIYSDVTNMEIKISSTTLTPAIGSAMLGAVAAGPERGGYHTLLEAGKRMARIKEETFKPIPSHVKIYEQLYKEYIALFKYFGKGSNQVMKRLRAIQKNQV